MIDISRINSPHVSSINNALSDHDAQYLVLNDVFTKSRGDNSLLRRRFFTTDAIHNFLTDLSYETWDEIYLYDNINQIFNSFLNTFLRLFESSFPMQYVNRKLVYNSWMMNGIRISCKRKQCLYSLLKLSNCPATKEYYSRYCIILRKVIRKAKQMYYKSLIMSSENKSKTAWNIIKIESGKSNTTMHLPSFFKLDDSIIHSDYVTEVFNGYFCNLVDKLNVNSPSMDSAMNLLRTSFPNGFSTLEVVPITVAEVLCTITSLKNKHSAGYNDISNRTPKLCGQYISKLLAYIYNKYLTIGVFPDWLKYARIVPLFKKGDRAFISNCRPISILTRFSKIFEILMYCRLNQHMTIHNVTVPEQFSFRKGKSINNATYKVLETLLSMEQKKSYCRYFL
jgi:hypothetical protein